MECGNVKMVNGKELDSSMYRDKFEYEVHACTKSELAMEYSPDIERRSAVNRLAKWMKHHPQLWKELLATGYVPKQKVFTSKQVEIIMHYLGEP